MDEELDVAFADRRRRRRRGWMEIGFGLALIIGSILVTWYTLSAAIARGGGSYLIWQGGAFAGFIAVIRGLLRLLGVEEDAHALRTKPKRPKQTVQVAFGFKSFVAWRYLMAREHRFSRPVLVVFLGGVFLIVMG